MLVGRPDNTMVGPTERGLQGVGALRPYFWQRNEVAIACRALGAHRSAADALTRARRSQIQRAVASPFVHSGLIDMCVALFIQVRFGFPIERDWGTQQTAALFVTGGERRRRRRAPPRRAQRGHPLLSARLRTAGINAAVLSSACYESRTTVVGLGALFALLGGKAGQIIVTWRKTDERARTLSTIMLVLAMVAFTRPHVGPLECQSRLAR